MYPSGSELPMKLLLDLTRKFVFCCSVEGNALEFGKDGFFFENVGVDLTVDFCRSRLLNIFLTGSTLGFMCRIVFFCCLLKYWG